MNNLPMVFQETSLGLDKSHFDQYQSLDEKKDLYAEIKKAAATTSWMQADFFKYLWKETNEKTLKTFAASVHEAPGTVRNYIQTAQAFEGDERNPMLTFSHHFQAALSDSYDSKTKTFTTDNRHKWLEKAADEGLTTRQLNEDIMRTKKLQELGTATAPCGFCTDTTGTIIPFNFFNTVSKHTDHYNFHESCYQQVLLYAKNHNQA